MKENNLKTLYVYMTTILCTLITIVFIVSERNKIMAAPILTECSEINVEPIVTSQVTTIVENDNNFQSEELDQLEKIMNQQNHELRMVQYLAYISEHPDQSLNRLYNLSEEDIYLLQRMAETETYGGGFNAKCNVISVALNRLRNERFANEMSGIIKTGQFVFSKTSISDETKLATEYCLIFGDTAQGALFFESASSNVHAHAHHFLFQDEVGHKFYN